MYLLTKLKIELESFILENVMLVDFFMEMAFLKQIPSIILDSSIKALNIFMADKSTHMRFMKENLSLILEEDMVSDTQKIMLMRVNLIKSFYMEQENGEMEMFTKEVILMITDMVMDKCTGNKNAATKVIGIMVSNYNKVI